MPSELFKKGPENFPIIVDYGISLETAWELASHVFRWTTVNLNLGERALPLSSGIQTFTVYPATLLRDADWLGEEMQDAFRKEGIFPADIRQLLAFLRFHGETQVTPEKPSPIVAAAPGSTWRCSHDCLIEMAGVRWDTFYKNPGPCWGVESNPFKAGMRFLAIRV